MNVAGGRTWVGADIKGIVFDAVGTLIYPLPSVAEVYAVAAQRQGVSLDHAEVKARFYRHFGDDEVDEQRGPLATDEATEVRRWRRIVSRVLPDLPDPERAFAELWDHFGRSQSWRLDPDAAMTVDALRKAGLRLRIGSNFDGRLRGVLRGLPGLKSLDDPILISSEIGFRKPHPAFYEAACASLSLPPRQILWVGDDLENDYRGPIRSGLQAVILDREAIVTDGAIRRVRSLSEIRPGASANRQQP